MASNYTQKQYPSMSSEDIEYWNAKLRESAKKAHVLRVENAKRVEEIVDELKMEHNAAKIAKRDDADRLSRAKEQVRIEKMKERAALAAERRRISDERSANFKAKKAYWASLDAYDIRIEKYKERAAAKKINYDLTKDQFIDIVTASCTYCGESGGSVDRIDSKLGYFSSNCQPVCVSCNMMKYTFTESFFLDKVRKICQFKQL